ncbi:hypothetical protein AXX17_AT3G35450 [Arabidopsis thaliana]|uniref:Pentatricopeptide repeat-containing protein n=1 Tax=Arabidopsis thaliana TaxID=3702 RepID=A0A178V705_ARATH|nr:hypothetical protein AXX17_AT3G35450 [Arabidopsis thaliana]
MRYEDSIWNRVTKGRNSYTAGDWLFTSLEIDTSPDVITYNVLVSGCARNGHADEALEIYEIMKEEGLQPNDVTHNVIIEGLCSERKVKEAEDFLESLEQKCPENYASLVKCYYESSLSKKAFEQFVRLEFLLRKSVYIKLFTSLCIEGYLDKALRVLKTMWAYRVEPGKSMCGKMIGALCRLNKLQKADSLFEDMKQRGIKPDVVTVLLDSWIQSIMRQVLFKKNGVEPDIVAYTGLISAYCHEGYIDKAVTLVTELSKKDILPTGHFGAVVKRAALKQKRFQYNYGEHMQQERVSHAKEELAWYRASSGKNLHSNIDKTHQLSTKLKETEEDSMQLAPASSRQNLVGLLKSEQNHFRLIQEETVKLARVL